MPNRIKIDNPELAGALLARVRHAHRAWRAAGITPLDHLVLLEVAAVNLRAYTRDTGRSPADIRPHQRGATGAEVARALHISTPTASRRLKVLVETGWLLYRTKGFDRGYWATQKTANAAEPLLGSLLARLEGLRAIAKEAKKTVKK